MENEKKSTVATIINRIQKLLFLSIYSELNIIIGVRNKDFEPAIRAIYDTFIEDKKKN